jgi:hypothetical protein
VARLRGRRQPSITYERDVAAAAKLFAEASRTTDLKPLELSRPQADRIVSDLAPGHEVLSRRLATLVRIGARNEWRRLATDSLRQSGIHPRPGSLAVVDVRSATCTG